MTAKPQAIILLSGMGADERVFAELMSEIEGIRVPGWIPPLEGESLASYAKRLVAGVTTEGPCFVGGASFGGFVAIEMAACLDAQACFLIGSARGPEGFPAAVRAMRKIPWAARAVPYELTTLLARAALLSRGSDGNAVGTALLEQLSGMDAAFLRWACRAVLEWDGVASLSVPVYQIHGRLDPVLPVELTLADSIVDGAGHAISMTHPHEVARFLTRKMAMHCAG
jgi:pimeloyl-ACP methyl ester carboxylesterase